MPYLLTMVGVRAAALLFTIYSRRRLWKHLSKILIFVLRCRLLHMHTISFTCGNGFKTRYSYSTVDQNWTPNHEPKHPDIYKYIEVMITLLNCMVLVIDKKPNTKGFATLTPRIVRLTIRLSHYCRGKWICYLHRKRRDIADKSLKNA